MLDLIKLPYDTVRLIAIFKKFVLMEFNIIQFINYKQFLAFNCLHISIASIKFLIMVILNAMSNGYKLKIVRIKLLSLIEIFLMVYLIYRTRNFIQIIYNSSIYYSYKFNKNQKFL